MMIKKITVLCISFILICSMSCSKNGSKASKGESEGIKWVSFDELNALQKTKPRKVVIDVYTDWCGWCKVMDKKTFSKPEIGKYVNKNFYAVKLDAESNTKVLYKGEVLSSAELAGRVWQIGSYPTTVYLDENMDLITQPVSGYLDSTQFNKIVHYFGENAYKSKSFDSYTVE